MSPFSAGEDHGAEPAPQLAAAMPAPQCAVGEEPALHAAPLARATFAQLEVELGKGRERWIGAHAIRLSWAIQGMPDAGGETFRAIARFLVAVIRIVVVLSQTVPWPLLRHRNDMGDYGAALAGPRGASQ